MAIKKKNGQRVGSVPYGFDLGADDTTLVPNAAEQQTIQEIHAMRQAGKTLAAIADDLTTQGVPTKTGKSVRWTHQAVARILSR